MKPIDALLSKVDWKCAACGAPAGSCGCFVDCSCGWSARAGEKCNNPVHDMVREIVDAVDHEMRRLYPDIMKHASGGFRRTLRAQIERQALKSMGQG